jgi:hypothetical protein
LGTLPRSKKEAYAERERHLSRRGGMMRVPVSLRRHSTVQNFDDLGLSKHKVKIMSEKVQEQDDGEDWMGNSGDSDSDSEDNKKQEEQTPSGFFGKEEIPAGLSVTSEAKIVPLHSESPTSGRNARRVLRRGPSISSMGGQGGSQEADAPVSDKRKIIKLNRSATYITDTSSKIRKTVVSKGFNGNVKASRIVSAIVDVLSRVYIRSRHLALITKWFKLGKCHKTRHFGTYRVELVVLLFSRVVDTHNFDLVLNVLAPYEAACVTCRLGILNIFNPTKPEGPVCLGGLAFLLLLTTMLLLLLFCHCYLLLLIYSMMKTLTISL